ncbi:MAG: 16S rRNA (cytidine(1402)-2'-O)-methyltransferase [Chloroflexota bacterium]|nr:16S rRNA (cytidine(1402)-2'-O)-methyltransferase [Chloroflexota bacterium]MDE2885494.1 16S rRNA (cytidine(1402)-2'-O)-methyltransferase [Chloroflexota bacterium]
MSGTLYVVATPIGNLEDLTPRAARILGEVALIAAEDTRQTRKLLSYLALSTRTVSYNQHNARQRAPMLFGALREGDVALVTDAGAPGVSDPGSDLVTGAAERGYTVVSVPGPSAVTAALAVAGFPADTFHFLGFLPRTTKARRSALVHVSLLRPTLVLFEAPHRLLATLAAIAETLGDRRIAVCREMTKVHEEVFRGTVREAIAHFAVPRGEFTLVIEGAPHASVSEPPAVEEIAAAMTDARASGLSRRDAALQVSSELGVSRRAAYAAWERG